MLFKNIVSDHASMVISLIFHLGPFLWFLSATCYKGSKCNMRSGNVEGQFDRRKGRLSPWRVLNLNFLVLFEDLRK